MDPSRGRPRTGSSLLLDKVGGGGLATRHHDYLKTRRARTAGDAPDGSDGVEYRGAYDESLMHKSLGRSSGRDGVLDGGVVGEPPLTASREGTAKRGKGHPMLTMSRSLPDIRF